MQFRGRYIYEMLLNYAHHVIPHAKKGNFSNQMESIGQMANTRAGKPEPLRGLGKVQKTIAPFGGH